MKLEDPANIRVAADILGHDDGARDPDAVGGWGPTSVWMRRAAWSREVRMITRALRHADANTTTAFYAFPKRGPKP